MGLLLLPLETATIHHLEVYDNVICVVFLVDLSVAGNHTGTYHRWTRDAHGSRDHRALASILVPPSPTREGSETGSGPDPVKHDLTEIRAGLGAQHRMLSERPLPDD